MSAVPTQQQHHDTLAEREAAAHPTSFDVICDWVELVVVCAFGTAVGAFVLGAVVSHLQRH